MPGLKKGTLQISIWSRDDDAVAAFVNSVSSARLLLGENNQAVLFSGIGVKQLRASPKR
jgi:hypothetical protein